MTSDPSPSPRRRAPERAPEWIVAACLALAAGVLFGCTLCPTVYWYDSAEFAANAAALGVPHPPGYPLYTLIAHVFTWLPGEPAWGVNVMSLVFGVAGVVLMFAIARTLGASLAAATIAGATLATAKTMWANAVVAEVYTPGLVMTLGALLLLLRARTFKPGLWLAGLVGGLGVGMHMSITTFGIGYAWLLWTHDLPQRFDLAALWSDLRQRIQTAGRSALAAVGGLLIFLYVPLVKFEKWDAMEWTTFRKNSTGGAFKRKFLKEYDFGDRFDFVSGIFVDNLWVVGLLLALVGLAWLAVHRRRDAVGIVLAGGGNLWWFFNYKVPDLDVFFLPAIAVLCLGVGLSVDALTTPLSRRWPIARWLGWALLALPLLFVRRNYDEVDLSDATEAATYGETACGSVPPNSRIVLFSTPNEWRYYSVFLYVQKALRQCVDVQIWKKPKVDRIRRAIRRGEPVFAFREMGQLRSAFQFEPTGPLWRLRPGRAVRSRPARDHHTPKPRP